MAAAAYPSPETSPVKPPVAGFFGRLPASERPSPALAELVGYDEADDSYAFSFESRDNSGIVRIDGHGSEEAVCDAASTPVETLRGLAGFLWVNDAVRRKQAELHAGTRRLLARKLDALVQVLADRESRDVPGDRPSTPPPEGSFGTDTKAQLDRLISELNNIQRALKDEISKNAALDARIVGLETGLKDATVREREATQKLLTAKMNFLEEMDSIGLAFSALKRERDGLKGGVEVLGKRLGEFASTMNNLEVKAGAQGATIDHLNGKIADLTREAGGLNAQIEDLSVKWNEAEARSAEFERIAGDYETDAMETLRLKEENQRLKEKLLEYEGEDFDPSMDPRGLVLKLKHRDRTIRDLWAKLHRLQGRVEE